MARYDFITNDSCELVNGGATQPSPAITFRGIDVSNLARNYAVHRQLNSQVSAVRQKAATPDAVLHQEIEQRSSWLHRILDRLAALSKSQTPSKPSLVKSSEPLFKPR